jgi:predicted DCC family thiol-disulfide oxidoreductase YuxK
MTTEVAKRQLQLVYDGECPMCIASVAFLTRRGLVAAEQTVSNHDLPPDDLAAAKAAGIRNQLVVLDAHTRATRTGADGLLWIIGENRGYPSWVRLASLPFVKPFVRFAYEGISYNRRILSPPRHAIRCDCEPQATLARRLALVAPLMLLTAAIAAGFGAAVFHGLERNAASGALVALSAFVAAALALTIVATIALRSEQRIDYLAHQAVVAFAGALAIFPATVVSTWFTPIASALVACLSLAASFVLMFRMQRRRLAALGLSDFWRWTWAAIAAIIVVAVAFVLIRV